MGGRDRDGEWNGNVKGLVKDCLIWGQMMPDMAVDLHGWPRGMPPAAFALFAPGPFGRPAPPRSPSALPHGRSAAATGRDSGEADPAPWTEGRTGF